MDKIKLLFVAGLIACGCFSVASAADLPLFSKDTETVLSIDSVITIPANTGSRNDIVCNGMPVQAVQVQVDKVVKTVYFNYFPFDASGPGYGYVGPVGRGTSVQFRVVRQNYHCGAVVSFSSSSSGPFNPATSWQIVSISTLTSTLTPTPAPAPTPTPTPPLPTPTPTPISTPISTATPTVAASIPDVTYNGTGGTTSSTMYFKFTATNNTPYVPNSFFVIEASMLPKGSSKMTSYRVGCTVPAGSSVFSASFRIPAMGVLKQMKITAYSPTKIALGSTTKILNIDPRAIAY